MVGARSYTPFGRVEQATGALAAMGYTGEPQDSLVYLRARYYHPALGRFLTPDSMVPDVLNGQAWNGHALKTQLDICTRLCYSIRDSQEV